MKTYRILKSFNGSQTGTDSQEFIAGTEVAISDHLANALAGTGWIAPVDAHVFQSTKTGATQVVTFVENRETKVQAPVETKVEEPAEEKKPGKKKR